MSIVMVKQGQGDSHIKRKKKSYAVGKVLCSFMEKKVTKVGREATKKSSREQDQATRLGSLSSEFVGEKLSFSVCIPASFFHFFKTMKHNADVKFKSQFSVTVTDGQMNA